MDTCRPSWAPRSTCGTRRQVLVLHGVTGENYLRGVRSGRLRLGDLHHDLPGLLRRRWPIHLEAPTRPAPAAPDWKMSQSRRPSRSDRRTQTGYTASVGNLSRVSLATDNVFRDDQGIHQLPVMSGSATVGFTAAITFGI